MAVGITALVFVCVLSLISPAFSKSLTISAQPIVDFDPRVPGQTRFGKVEFVGGLVLTSDHEDFGGLSAFRFTDDDGSFLALTDKARVITGSIVREGDTPVGFTDTRITRIKAANGKTITGAGQKDSESVAIVGNHIAVGYERNHRIAFLKRRKRKLVMDKNRPAIDFNSYGFTNNGGLEAIALHPDKEKLYAFPEAALNENGFYRGFIVENGKVVKEIELSDRDGYSLTDAQFLPTGDLLMLERYYTPFIGVFLKIRQISASALASNEPLGGEVLIDATGRQQIDNMEGLSLSRFADGSTRITLVSDDNFSASQRTLLLEFRLLE